MVLQHKRNFDDCCRKICKKIFIQDCWIWKIVLHLHFASRVNISKNRLKPIRKQYNRLFENSLKANLLWENLRVDRLHWTEERLRILKHLCQSCDRIVKVKTVNYSNHWKKTLLGLYQVIWCFVDRCNWWWIWVKTDFRLFIGVEHSVESQISKI